MELKEILARIERRLKKVNLTPHAASKKAKKPDAVRNMRRAVDEGRTGVNVETIAALAPVLSTTIAWLLDASGPEELDEATEFQPKKPMSRVVGYAGAGATTHFYTLPEQDLDEVEAPIGATPYTRAIEIRGQSLGRMFDRWYAFFDDVRSPVTNDLLGHLCVIGTADGRTLIKKIERGSHAGLFKLVSEREDPIEEAQIEWAARVTQMSPR
jgi:hypothetical protein